MGQSKRSTMLLLIFALTLLCFGAVFTLYATYLLKTDRMIVESAIFILLCFLIPFAAWQISIALRSYNLTKKLAELEGLLKDNSTWYLGGLEDCLEYLEEYGAGFAKIRNAGIVEIDVSFFNADKQHMYRITKLVSESVNRGAYWDDIISIKGRDGAAAIMEQIDVNKQRFYKMHLLEPELPIFKFLYLGNYKNGNGNKYKNTVIFGFSTSADHELFISTDARLTQGFHDLFCKYREYYCKAV